MAKQTAPDGDEKNLRKKIGERLPATENPEGDPALRSLRKRLKRAQRKRRRLAERKRRALGRKAGAEAEKTAGA